MSIKKLITEKLKRLNETKEYYYKGDAMQDYYKGILTAKEVVGIANDIFHTEVATKKELQGLLDNNFMQDMAAEQHGIDKKVLVSKVKDLLKEI